MNEIQIYVHMDNGREALKVEGDFLMFTQLMDAIRQNGGNIPLLDTKGVAGNEPSKPSVRTFEASR